MGDGRAIPNALRQSAGLVPNPTAEDNVTKNRAALERTIGRITLDRMNGYKVTSVAEIFQEYGGTDPVTIRVLERAFGDDFDAVAAKGRKAITDVLAKHLREELAAHGARAASCSAGFRDIFFHCDPEMKLGDLLGPVFTARVKGVAHQG